MKHALQASVCLIACVVGTCGPALAHVELEEATAPAGSTYRAVLGVGHGCEGKATTGLHVLIDGSIGDVTIEPKDGWSIEIVDTVSTTGAAAREIVWSGGTLAPDAHDGFAFTAVLPAADPGTVIYFPVVQECGDEVHRWIETPLAAETPNSLNEPAPSLTLTEAAPRIDAR